MHAQLAPFGDVPVSFVARNHPDAMAAMTGLVTQPRTIRMIYAFQSPAAIAALVEKLGSPVVMLIAPDSTPEVGEVFRRCGITAITLEDSKVVTTLRGSPWEVDPAEQSAREPLLEVISPRMGPEWISTSDLVMIDADGFLFCIGRADGAIMRGGFKVSRKRSSRYLRLREAVASAAVIAANDPILHEVPMAIILLKRGIAVPDAAALNAYVRHHLPAPCAG